MKNIFRLIIILFAVSIFLNSCNKKENTEPNKEQIQTKSYQCPMDCEDGKIYDAEGSCPDCKMDLKEVKKSSKILADEDEISGESIFNLQSKWNTQDNQRIELKDLKGDVLVMVMIYTTCQAACPRLVADMRAIEKEVQDDNIKYVLISIDPETDTPKRMKEFAIENQMDSKQCVFLQGAIDDVRELSNVLSVKYKQISPLDFSHSNIISVFDKSGVLFHQQEGLGVNNTETISKINELVK